VQLCVSLPVAPTYVQCKGAVAAGGAVDPFLTPIALPASASSTQTTPLSQATSPNGIKTSEQSAFSVAFTKKGTASGYFEPEPDGGRR
jgi:hypothetical protein